MIWRQFKHPNVLQFYGVCEDVFAPQFAMVSPWMDNGDLTTYLGKHEDANRLRIVSISLYHSRTTAHMYPVEGCSFRPALPA